MSQNSTSTFDDLKDSETLANSTSKQLHDVRLDLMKKLKLEDSDKDLYWRRMQKINCIGMVDSCLVYGEDFFKARSYSFGSTFTYENYAKDLGIDTVRLLHDLRKSYFKEHVRIVRNVGRDSEGGSYNSIEEF